MAKPQPGEGVGFVPLLAGFRPSVSVWSGFGSCGSGPLRVQRGKGEGKRGAWGPGWRGGHGRGPGLEKPRGGGESDWDCMVVIICQCGCITVILCLYGCDCVASEVCVVCLLWLSLCALIVCGFVVMAVTVIVSLLVSVWLCVYDCHCVAAVVCSF